MEKLVIRKKDVARLLSISESTVTRWCDDAQMPLPFVLGSNRTVWLYSEILEHVQKLSTRRGFNKAKHATNDTENVNEPQ